MARWLRGCAGLLKTAASRRTPAAEYHTIEAVPREYTGCRVAAKERAQGRVPSVVLSPGDGGAPATRKELITTEARQIESLLRREKFFCSTRYGLDIRAGPGSEVIVKSGTVLPIKVHMEKETGKILNLVFAWAEEGQELKVDVPVIYKGENICPGLKKGGYLQKIRTSLKYLGPSELIPPKIEVNLAKLDIGDRVRMQDIEVDSSLKLLSKNETTPICKILATKPGEYGPTNTA